MSITKLSDSYLIVLDQWWITLIVTVAVVLGVGVAWLANLPQPRPEAWKGTG